MEQNVLLKIAEIFSLAFLIQFKDGECRVSLRFNLFPFSSDVNQGNKNFECKKVGSRFSSVAPWMESSSLDLLRAVKKCALEVGCVCVFVCVCV